MTRVRTLAALLAVLPLIVAQSATGAPPASKTVSGITATPEAINPSDLNDAEYAALVAIDPRTPHYSLEQMASFVCRTRTIQREFDAAKDAQRAFDATKAFEEAKDSERAGQKRLDDLIRAEAARQLAVQGLMNQLNIPVQHIADIGATTAGAMTIENVQFRFGNLGGELIIRLHAELRNSGAKPEPVPIVTATALDHFGIVLAQVGYGPPAGTKKPVTIPAGGAYPFDVVFHDGPQYTHEVKLTFGPPGSIRNPRTCAEVKPFKAVGQTLDVPRTGDAAQVALDDAAASPLQAQSVSARSIKTDDGRALRVTGSIRNTSTKDAAPSRLRIFIKDADGQAIGETQSNLNGMVHGGDTAPFDLVVKDFHWLSTDKGQGSLDQMKTVSVLVE